MQRLRDLEREFRERAAACGVEGWTEVLVHSDHVVFHFYNRKIYWRHNLTWTEVEHSLISAEATIASFPMWKYWPCE